MTDYTDYTYDMAEQWVQAKRWEYEWDQEDAQESEEAGWPLGDLPRPIDDLPF